jgi:hypothetical protein
MAKIAQPDAAGQQAGMPEGMDEKFDALGAQMGGLLADQTDTVDLTQPDPTPAPAAEPDPTPAPAPAPAAADPAPAAEPVTDPKPEPSGPSAAEVLAGVKHKDVVNSPAGKGLVKEVQKERKARQKAEAELKALRESQEQVPDDDDDGELDLSKFFDGEDDDPTPADPTEPTGTDFEKAVDAAVDKRLAPLLKERAEQQAADAMGAFDQSLKGLKKAQTEGTIPAALDVDATVITAVTWLDENRPEIMAGIRKGSSDPAAEAYQIGAALCPAVRDAISTAAAAPPKTPATDSVVDSVEAFTDIMTNLHG